MTYRAKVTFAGRAARATTFLSQQKIAPVTSRLRASGVPKRRWFAQSAESTLLSKRKLKPEYFIQFMGELPSIGDGWRGVAVKKIGTKWVYFVATGDQTPCRIALKLWKQIPKHVVKRNKMTGEVIF
jgi:hypothetical protein